MSSKAKHLASRRAKLQTLTWVVSVPLTLSMRVLSVQKSPLSIREGDYLEGTRVSFFS